MVLTRNQEAQLRKQYRLDESPSTPTTTKKVANQGLRSALKQHWNDKPWEERENRRFVLPENSKKVRIESENNVVFEFQKSPDDYTMSDSVSISEEEEIDEEYEPIVKRKLSLDRQDVQQTSDVFRGGALLAAAVLLMLSVTSSWLTVVMQSILKDERTSLPFLIPAISQIGCSMIVFMLKGLRLIRHGPMPTKQEYLAHFIPIALSTSLCMFLGNYAFIGLSLSFLSILKALTPAVTLVVGKIAGVEEFSSMAFLSTIMIAYGTGIATLDETNRAQEFHWRSFISFTASVLFESARVVFISGSMKQTTKYSPLDVIGIVGPLNFLFLGSASLLTEMNKIIDLSTDERYYISSKVVLIVVLSFGVNLSTYTAINLTSSTTVKVVGAFTRIKIFLVVLVFFLMVFKARSNFEGI